MPINQGDGSLIDFQSENRPLDCGMTYDDFRIFGKARLKQAAKRRIYWQ